MDARLLHVLHHRRDVRVPSVAERVDVDLQGAFQEAVDECRAARPRLECLEHLLRAVADAHGPAAQHVRGAHEHGIADALGDRDRPRRVVGDPPLRAANALVGEDVREAQAVLGQVDRLERRAEDRIAGVVERVGELQRRLAAELDRRRRPAARARTRRARTPRSAARSRGGRRCRSRWRRSPGCS